jgi:hypothetical protein
MAGKTESYAFLERFREARNCHRVYERQGDPVMYACPFVQVGPGEGSDGLKRIERGGGALDRQTGIRVQRATVLL